MLLLKKACSALRQDRLFLFSRPAPFRSVSTVHKDISERLPQFNRTLATQVQEVLAYNKAQRHIRGGLATREKYRELHAAARRMEESSK